MRVKQFALLTSVALFSACADYQFTVNDKVVYSPAPLFDEYEVGDSALENCLKQTIADANITAPIQLRELNCSHAGIENLTGIEVFTGITHLKLSSNAITDIGPLAALVVLQELELEGNLVRSLLPLRGNLNLAYLGLAGNANLNCAELNHFRTLPELEIQSPAHCP